MHIGNGIPQQLHTEQKGQDFSLSDNHDPLFTIETAMQSVSFISSEKKTAL
jgi:hypothetical protein